MKSNNQDISGKLFQQELVSEDKKHPLQNTWILWYHEPDSKDWSLESYKKIYEFDTIEDFWRLYNNLPSIVNSMFFLMKKGHPPIWEVPQNINGGAWLYKFPKKMADSFWLKFSCYLIGETIANCTDDIIGISISPKVFNVTIRIWNCNSKKCQDQLKFNPEYTELERGQPLYKEFRSQNTNNHQPNRFKVVNQQTNTSNRRYNKKQSHNNKNQKNVKKHQ